jgi:hypothetical protein
MHEDSLNAKLWKLSNMALAERKRANELRADLYNIREARRAEERERKVMVTHKAEEPKRPIRDVGVMRQVAHWINKFSANFSPAARRYQARGR